MDEHVGAVKNEKDKKTESEKKLFLPVAQIRGLALNHAKNKKAGNDRKVGDSGVCSTPVTLSSTVKYKKRVHIEEDENVYELIMGYETPSSA